MLRAPVALTVAGRTDRGVHALGQVASYEGAPPRLRSVNAVLPRRRSPCWRPRRRRGLLRPPRRARAHLRLPRAARSAPSPFERGRALWWPHPLDEAALHACAAALAGTHDFTAFTPTETYHQRFERDVLARALGARAATCSSSAIEADTFMRHMNRVLVGTMLEVAGGRRRLEDFVRLLEGRPRARGGAAPRRRTASTWPRYLLVRLTFPSASSGKRLS